MISNLSPIATQPLPPEWLDMFASQELVFGMLGKAIYIYPDREWLKSLVEQDVFDEVPFGADHPEIADGLEHLQQWAVDWHTGQPSATYEALKADYTRLFIGLGTVIAPPWESVHLSREKILFQEQTLQVRQWYLRFGLESEKLNKEPDDHIGLELSFLSHLSKLCLKAMEENDIVMLEQILQAKRQFISEHTLKWAPGWCKLVEENASTNFYRGLAKLIRGTLFSLAGTLGAQIPNGKKT